MLTATMVIINLLVIGYLAQRFLHMLTALIDALSEHTTAIRQHAVAVWEPPEEPAPWQRAENEYE